MPTSAPSSRRAACAISIAVSSLTAPCRSIVSRGTPVLDLQLGLIGDDAAAVVARASRHVGDGVAEHPAGEGLHGGEGEAALGEELPHVLFHRFVVDAPDVLAEAVAELGLDGADERVGLRFGSWLWQRGARGCRRGVRRRRCWGWRP